MAYLKKELTDAYMKNAAVSQTAQMLDAYINKPAKAWMMIREIIRIAPQDSKPYTAIIYEFHKLLTVHGKFIISDLEKEGCSNALLDRCLKHVIDNSRINPEVIDLSPILLNKIKKLCRQAVNLSRKKPLKKRDLPNSLREIVTAWCVYSETFWAFDELLATTMKSPVEALGIIVDLLNKTSDSKIVAIIAAGPLECLLLDHGVNLRKLIQKQAIFNKNMRIALASVWLDEEDTFYPYWAAMMKNFGYWEMINAHPLDEE